MSEFCRMCGFPLIPDDDHDGRWVCQACGWAMAADSPRTRMGIKAAVGIVLAASKGDPSAIAAVKAARR